MKAEQLANKWIKEMEAFGMTPDQMIETIALARKKYVTLIENSNKTLCESCARLDFSPSEKEHYCKMDYELKPIDKRPVKCGGFIESKHCR